ncbi:MAG: haloacid dehalogenase type II [Phycisphaerales bacterium]
MESHNAELNRRNFLKYSAAGTAIASSATLAAAQSITKEPMNNQSTKRPTCLFFDVNETLLDLNAMKTSVAKALDGRADLLPLWFTTMLQYSLVSTVGGKYEDFGVIGAAAMRMVANNHGLELTQEAALKSMSPIRSLPPHPDVAPALQKLKDAGFRMVTLTNSSNAAVEAQMRNAGLIDLFDERLSVEDIGLYKPHEHAYRWAARRVGVPASECMLIAAHGWDIAGALWSGWRGAFLARPGAQLYPLADSPEIVVPTLTGATEQLLKMSV